MRTLLLLLLPLTFLHCSNPDDDIVGTQPEDGAWLLPADEIFDGGPGKDGIPAVDAPQFDPAAQASALAPEELVVGIAVDGVYRAYPHTILDWHEIVNDEIGTLPFAVTYCPLTGTAIGYDRRIDGTPTTFGVSGLLYNTNLIPYDRASDSNWSQIERRSVQGALAGRAAATVPLIETTWETWQGWFPQTTVLSTRTGYSRNYGQYPYGNYRVAEQLFYPIVPDDRRLHRKTRGLIVVGPNGESFFPLTAFGDSLRVAAAEVGDLPIVVAGDGDRNFIVAYQRRLPDGTLLDFTAATDGANNTLLRDQEGTIWNVLGEAISGPRTGTRLQTTESFMAYWLAAGSFFPGITIDTL